MRTKIEDRIESELEEFVTKLKQSFGSYVTKVILFGSIARGEYNEYSDIDLLVVTNDGDKKLESEIFDLSTDLMLKYGPYLSVKVYSEDRFSKLAKLETPFMKNIQSEGKVLWERPNRR